MHGEIAIRVNPCRDNGAHRARPTAAEGACACAQRRPRCQHVVDKGDRGPIVAWRDRKRTTHLHHSGGGRRPTLLDVIARTRHRVEHCHAPKPTKVACNDLCGIEATAASPLDGARHGNEHPSRRFNTCGDQLREGDGDASPSAIFEGVDERSDRSRENHAMTDQVELPRALGACRNRHVPWMPAPCTAGRNRTDQVPITVVAKVASRNAAGRARRGEDEFQKGVQHTWDRARAPVTCLCQNRTSVSIPPPRCGADQRTGAAPHVNWPIDHFNAIAQSANWPIGRFSRRRLPLHCHRTDKWPSDRESTSGMNPLSQLAN